MKLAIDILFALVSHLPKFVSWWLYSPKRTKEKVEVSISAQEGSVEFWCDKRQSCFNVILEFKNNNPFPIEIDRVEISAQLHSTSIKAFELFGAKLKNNSKANIYLRGKLDQSSLIQINQTLPDARLRLEVRSIIINKYHYIRDFKYSFDNLMYKCYNKKTQLSSDSDNIEQGQ